MNVLFVMVTALQADRKFLKTKIESVEVHQFGLVWRLCCVDRFLSSMDPYGH